jgi:hypothetical protein
MKLTKKILREIIKEVITEEKLNEATSTRTASPKAGIAKGDPSPAEKQAQTDYEDHQGSEPTKYERVYDVDTKSYTDSYGGSSNTVSQDKKHTSHKNYSDLRTLVQQMSVKAKDIGVRKNAGLTLAKMPDGIKFRSVPFQYNKNTGKGDAIGPRNAERTEWSSWNNKLDQLDKNREAKKGETRRSRAQSIASSRSQRKGGMKSGKGDKRGGRAVSKASAAKFAKLSGYEPVKDKKKGKDEEE